VLDGKAGADVMLGGGGNDIYIVDNAADVVTEVAGGGSDRVEARVNWTLGANFEDLGLGGSANLTGIGNDAGNAILGNAGNNRLEGRGGNDMLDGKAGADVMLGGVGNDVYWIDNAGDQAIETAGQGNDQVFSRINWVLGPNLESLVLDGGGSINGTGNDLNNALYGTRGANVLNGLGGNDSLKGGQGADIFVLGLRGGKDIVEDFRASEGDKLDLRAFGGASKATFTQVGASTLISFAGGESLQLLGVSATDAAMKASILW
jgi:Ca2+-binding RTX toxin-like protein